MFGDPYENSMGWPMMGLAEVAKVDGTMTKEYERYADYPHIGIDSIEKNTGVLSGYRTVKQDNVISPKYHFGPQHILYSKIRPALNKVAVPDFEGLCSADCYPLLPIGGFCERKFLAHVLRSEYFLNYILSFSVRSQMPKVNRKQLEGFRFPCPPISLQRQFVRIIEQSDKSKFVRSKSQFIEMFGSPIDNPRGWPTKGLTELGSCKNGMNFGARDQGVTIQSVGVGDIKDLDYISDISVLTTLSLNEIPSDEYLLKDGDLVFVRSNGNKNLVGRCVAIYPHDIPVTFSGFCIRFRKECEDVRLDYLLRFLKLPEVRAKMAGRGANIQNLNQKILAALQVPVPPVELQEQYVEFVQQSDKSK